MEEKIYWNKISTIDIEKMNLACEDFYKLMDCYYGNIFITDGEGYILYLNKWGGNFVGQSRTQFLGKHVSSLVDEGIWTGSVTQKVLEERRTVDMEMTDRDGNKFWVHAVPIFDDDDNILYTVHYNQYESEVVKFLGEVERSRKTIEHMREVLTYYSESMSSGVMVYRSEAMEQLLHYARKIAKTDAAVLIGGESGTGKELLSHYIYEESNRNRELFLPINCAALPRELIESELFGYAPGAFTGADRRGKTGAFELANGGTIFLDEVGEIPLHVQAKLLRVLESGEFMPVGSSKVKSVDVRIIAATNRNLEEMVREGAFRGDLYYRLNVLPLELPPLRKRKEDIIPLAEFYLKQYNTRYGTQKHLSEKQKREFMSYSWPGNVRELKNIIHRTIVSDEKRFGFPVSGPQMESPEEERKETCKLEKQASEGMCDQAPGDLREAMQKFEREFIQRAIEAADGNVTQAAKTLGVHRTYIYRKLKSENKEEFGKMS